MKFRQKKRPKRDKQCVLVIMNKELINGPQLSWNSTEIFKCELFCLTTQMTEISQKNFTKRAKQYHFNIIKSFYCNANIF